MVTAGHWVVYVNVPMFYIFFLMKNESGEVQAAATFLLLIIFGLKENEFEIEKSVWPFFFF